MYPMSWSSRAVKCVAASCALSIVSLTTFAQEYVQTNLVSDIPQAPNADGTVVTIDKHLKNPWGLARGPATPWWPNDDGTGVATLYTGAGAITPLVVTIPGATGTTTPSSPTGMVFNGTTDFALAPNNPRHSFLRQSRGPYQAGDHRQRRLLRQVRRPPSTRWTNRKPALSLRA
jgi:hypothetical protein